jgi:hypothetical protein
MNDPLILLELFLFFNVMIATCIVYFKFGKKEEEREPRAAKDNLGL